MKTFKQFTEETYNHPTARGLTKTGEHVYRTGKNGKPEYGKVVRHTNSTADVEWSDGSKTKHSQWSGKGHKGAATIDHPHHTEDGKVVRMYRNPDGSRVTPEQHKKHLERMETKRSVK